MTDTREFLVQSRNFDAQNDATLTNKPPLSPQNTLSRSPASVSSLLGFVVLFSAITGFMMGFDLSIIAIVLAPINDEFVLCSPKEFTCFRKDLFVAMIAPGALVR